MKKIQVLICIFILLPVFTFAQELDATVTVNREQLDTSSRDRIDNFQNQIQDYLNNTKFTRQPWEGERIKCLFNVFFQGSSDEVTYTAQMVVTSQRPIDSTQSNSLMMKIMDNSWQFKYQKNQAMYFNQTDFDPLTSFLDFYAYIIIGFDSDSFEKFGGTDYFQKALDICARGGSSQFSNGWQTESNAYNRRVLLDNLLNAKYQQFRQDYFDYHYNGLDLFNTKNMNKRQTAYNNIVKLIINLDKVRDQIDTRSVLLKVFFDAKAEELVKYLKVYSDKTIFTTLKRLDPPHASKYDEGMK